MTGKRLLRRVLAVAGVLCGFLLFVAVTHSEATPIRPDVKKLINQPQQPEIHFAPARAGWNGPEMARSEGEPGSALFAVISEGQAVRASLVSAFVPDPRVLAFLAVLILLLRQFTSWQSSRNSGPEVRVRVAEIATPQDPQEFRPAA